MKRASHIWYLMCFLINRMSFNYRKGQIILSGARKKNLGYIQYTFFSVCLLKKNAQMTPITTVVYWQRQLFLILMFSAVKFIINWNIDHRRNLIVHYGYAPQTWRRTNICFDYNALIPHNFTHYAKRSVDNPTTYRRGDSRHIAYSKWYTDDTSRNRSRIWK